MERGDVGDAERSGGAGRDRVGTRRAEPRQPVEEVGSRRGSDEPGLSYGREPHAHRGLPAAERQPVCDASQIEVEAIVGRGLSRRVIVTAVGITGLDRASSVAMRRGCSRTREADACRGAKLRGALLAVVPGRSSVLWSPLQALRSPQTAANRGLTSAGAFGLTMLRRTPAPSVRSAIASSSPRRMACGNVTSERT